MAAKEKRESDTIQLGRTAYRPFWVLKLSIGIRAIHQVGAAVFLASFLIDEVIVLPPFYLYLAIFSGMALMIVEGMRHRQMYRELSGFCTCLKLCLIGAAYHGLFPQTLTVLAAFILASIGSHAPKIFRHRLLF